MILSNKVTQKPLIVLGIDPGTRRAGWSIIQYDHAGLRLIALDTLSLSPSLPLPTRVGIFGEFMAKLLEKHNITAIALETAFVAKNAQTFHKLGFLRGVLYYLAYQKSCVITELAPMQVKQAITGWGAAPKEQVARVLHQLFPTLPAQQHEDATDALAVALAGLWQLQQQALVAQSQFKPANTKDLAQ